MRTLRDVLRTAVETGVLPKNLQQRSCSEEVRSILKVRGADVSSIKEAAAAAFWRTASWDHPNTKRAAFKFYKAPRPLPENLYLDCCEILTLQKEFGYVTPFLWAQRASPLGLSFESAKRHFERVKERLRKHQIPTKTLEIRESRDARVYDYDTRFSPTVRGIRIDLSQEEFDERHASPRMFPHDYFSQG